MTRVILGLTFLALVCSCVGCGKGPEVLQGKVVSYDSAAQDLIVKDERDGDRQVRLSLAQAEIGAEPQPDDLVRVAYREAEGRPVASRVMNLTRQKELAGRREQGSPKQ